MYLKHVLQSNHFNYLTLVDVDVFEACSSMKSL